MKKIILLFVFVVFVVQYGLCADTSYIKSGQNRDNNYLSNAVSNNGKITKWDKSVIYVHIKPCANTKKNPVLSAIRLYNSTFSGTFQFRITEKKEKADITIEFVDEIDYKNTISGGSAGVTHYMYDNNNRLVLAKIKLSNKYLKTPSQIKQVSLHELGHALGIMGHSLNQNDVMYPTTEGKGTLSRRDINTINLLYKGKTYAVKKNLENYGEKQAEMDLEVLLRDTKGASNNYNVWINLGDFYYKNKNYKKAIETYQTALTKDGAPKSTINKKISYCYTGLGKKTLADKYMKAAQK